MSPQPRAFCERLATEPVVVSSLNEFMAVRRDAKTVTFIDSSAIAILDDLAAQLGADDMSPPEWRKVVAAMSLGTVILISTDTPEATTAAFYARPWLSHVLSEAMLDHPLGMSQLRHVFEASASRTPPKLIDWIPPDVSGRRIRLALASRRFDRLKRMVEFASSKGVSERAQQVLRDAADELLTNAFYNAPVAAGAAELPIPRNQDVSLPDESAVDLAYGCDGTFSFVRVRDPFGSLSRARLVDVLSRTAHSGQPEIDDSMGGAGLGLQRVFAAASLVAISVDGNHQTEVLVGVLDDAMGSARGPRPYAFHLFFKENASRRRLWKAANQDTAVSDPAFANSFVSIVLVNEPT